MRRLLLLLCACLLSSVIAIAVDNGYYYRSWKSHVNVSPDNTWSVTEDYDVTFNEQRHGIYRYIQNEFGANRNINPEGEPRDVHYKVYRPKIKVQRAYGAEIDINESDENDCTVIRWGSADAYVYGDQSYGVEYTYQTPDDRVEVRDYIFHSLIPTGVPTTIQRYDFVLNFEKPLPSDIAERLNIYCGPQGSEHLARVDGLTITPTCISGTIHDIEPYSAVTFFAELPEGYYEGTFSTSKTPGLVCLYLSIGLALLLLFYEFTSHGPSITKSVEFYAPSDVTPTLVGKIIDGSTDNIDIAALIPWLAHYGYLTIEEIPKEGGLFGKKGDVVVRKVMDLPDDAPKYQQKIMNLLFCDGDELYISKIGDRHSKVESAKSAVDKIFTGDKQLTVSHHGGLMVLLLLASTAAIFLSSPVKLFYIDNVILGAIWLVSFAFAWSGRSKQAEQALFASSWKKLLTLAGRLLAFLVVLLMCYVILFDENENIFTPLQMIGMAVLCYLACEFSVRNVVDTPYRAEMAGKLLGFREFIDTAEKDRLRMLVDQDPEYFYKVLPYAMIFGMTTKWADLFRDIEIPRANWYISPYSSFNGAQFCQSMNNFSTSISNAIATSAVDHTKSSSSGGGGGGFSGGGGGGGGAGSW